MANDTRFKELTDEERARVARDRRRSLESELWSLEVSRIGAANRDANKDRIAEIEAALKEVDALTAE